MQWIHVADSRFFKKTLSIQIGSKTKLLHFFRTQIFFIDKEFQHKDFNLMNQKEEMNL